MARTSRTNTEYIKNGVAITPTNLSTGDMAKITYDGVLSKSGAEHVFAHVGFGNQWNKTYDYMMNKTSKGFEIELPVNISDTLNVCFKDCANNWDNNTGNNYNFYIS